MFSALYPTLKKKVLAIVIALSMLKVKSQKENLWKIESCLLNKHCATSSPCSWMAVTLSGFSSMKKELGRLILQ